MLCFLQLLFNKHSWPDNQGVRWPWNSHLWTGWGTWTDAEAAGFSEQVRGSRTAAQPDLGRWGLCAGEDYSSPSYWVQWIDALIWNLSFTSRFEGEIFVGGNMWVLSLKNNPTVLPPLRCAVISLFNLQRRLCTQDPVEEVLLLWWRWIYSGRFSTTACPVHLGEEYRKPGENPPRDQRRAALGCCSKKTIRFYRVSCYFEN